MEGDSRFEIQNEITASILRRSELDPSEFEREDEDYWELPDGADE